MLFQSVEVVEESLRWTGLDTEGAAVIEEEKNNWVAPVSTEDVCLKRLCGMVRKLRSYSRLWTDYVYLNKQDLICKLKKKNREAHIDRSVIPMMAVSAQWGWTNWRTCSFCGSHTVEVNGETIKGKHIVIATGAILLFLLFLELNLAKRLMMSLLGKNSLHLLPLLELATLRWN